MMHLDIKGSKEVVNNKGNIPIKKELLNKYSTVEEIINNEKKNIFNKISLIDNIDIKVTFLNSNKAKKYAYQLFFDKHRAKIFKNIDSGCYIIVNKSSINECIHKIFGSRKQRDFLKEHLIVFSNLGIIIEQARLVNQVLENKNRNKYKSWNYYFLNIIINNTEYILEFDVVSLDNKENHYHVQRIDLKHKKTGERNGDVDNKYQNLAI